MKKLLLILICLFVSFKVKSEERLVRIPMKDCLKYLDKGKIIHKEKTKGVGKVNVQTFFSYKQKIYIHNLFLFDEPGLTGKILDNTHCKVFDVKED